MSNQRKERLRQLEKEREHFYSSQRRQESNSDSVCFADDYPTIKQKYNVGREGMEYNTDRDRFEPLNESDLGYKESSYRPDRKQEIDALVKAQRGKLDAFDRLVVKEARNRAKYHKSDKTLLEEERARNAALEDSYEQLVSQVQHLQNTHLQDLRSSEQRFHSASSALQKALVSKADELVNVSNKLASSEGRYERESREWSKERLTLKSQVETLTARDAELSAKLADRERKLNELAKFRKDLVERVASREQDLVKYGKALREREADFNAEKEQRMRLELKNIKLEQELERVDALLKEAEQIKLQKQAEIDQLDKFRYSVKEYQKDIENYERREKQYQTEIDQLSARERRAAAQLESYANQERKTSQEIMRLNESYEITLKKLDEASRNEFAFKKEIENTAMKISHYKDEIARFQELVSQYQKDSSKLLNDFSAIQLANQELKNMNSSLTRERDIAENKKFSLEGELEIIQNKVAELNQTNSSLRKQLDNANEEIVMISNRLSQELEQQNVQRAQNKEKYNNVSIKITELQNTLTETTVQLAELQANEKELQNTLRQKDEKLKFQAMALQESEHRITELLNASSKEHMEYEAYKNKKRDEILALQDKYTQAKHAMDAEVTKLMYQFNQKNSQTAIANDEINALRKEIKELTMQKSSLESQINELVSGETSFQRQVNGLNATLSQKQNEMQRLVSKNNQLVDQLKRLEDELKMYRDNNGIVNDSDITRMQSNMEEISKRLKSQVDGLMEKEYESPPQKFKDYENSSRGGSLSGQKSGNDLHSRTGSALSSNQIKSRYTATTGSASPRILNIPQTLSEPSEELANLENIEKLLKRTKI